MTDSTRESFRPLVPAPSQCSLEAFLAHYGELFEHSPWVAERAWQQGLNASHDDPAALADTLGSVLLNASPEEQEEVIRAHPDLAGKAALAGKLTASSQNEQAGAGLDQCSPQELARFEALNSAYKQTFGFPFVIAVKGLDRYAILEAFETRLENSPAAERETAIEQITHIARFRLMALSEEAS